jgi:hypothetical protein
MGHVSGEPGANIFPPHPELPGLIHLQACLQGGIFEHLRGVPPIFILLFFLPPIFEILRIFLPMRRARLVAA